MIRLDLRHVVYYTIAAYYMGQRLAGVMLGLYLIFTHGQDVLHWATEEAVAPFPIAEAAHILAGLLLIKLSYYLRFWPSVCDYMRWQKRLIHSQ